MEWNVEANGKPCRVTVALSPQGKRVVRANGRIVAPPQPSGDVDCIFDVENARFRLFGTETELHLEAIKEEPTSHLQWRAVVFITTGTLLFLISAAGALFISAVNLRFHAMAIQDVEAGVTMSEDAASLGLRILNFVRTAYIFEALVGAALIVGGSLLLRHTLWAPRFLEAMSWCAFGVPLLLMFIIDTMSHRLLNIAATPVAALKWLRDFHAASAVLIVILAIGAGALLSFLQRDKLIEALAAHGRQS